MNLAKEIEKLLDSIQKLETKIEDQEVKLKTLETKIDLKTSSESNVRRWKFPKHFPTPWKQKSKKNSK